ncbi:MAG: hypothetical protein Q4G25_13115 [Paracoccus sp. (in: a-proteobacteria)]|nr:hypothetical protein [Paracoccus sp. (in: a-proteobacteria)]
MTSLTDEELMAFADGELSGADAARVARAVADDPALMARVELFRATHKAVAAAFPASDAAVAGDDPLAARIRAAVAARPSDEAGDTAGDTAAGPAADPMAARIRAAAMPPDAVTPLPADRHQPDRGQTGAQVLRDIPPPANRNWRPAAIAAGLGAVLLAGWWMGLFAQDGGAPAGIAPELVVALSTTASGSSAPAGDRRFTAIATYQNAAGDICREYELRHDDATEATLAVACHGAPGWQERFAVTLADGPDGAYATASGGIEGLDAYLSDSGAGEPLTPEAEAEALSQLR